MTPEFILSKEKVLSQYRTLKDLGVNISYSVKTNPHVARVLEDATDSQFSVHNLHELVHVRDVKRVWFLAHALTDSILELSRQKGIEKFVVDNLVDLEKLLAFANLHNLPIDLLLRMKLRENTIFTGKYFVFGMDARTTNEQIKRLHNNPSIRTLGIHFHRKTQNVSEWNLKAELSELLTMETMTSIKILNIGGGLPVAYKNVTADSLTSIIEQIKSLKNWLDEFGVSLHTEPGRFIAGPSVELHTKIISIVDKTITIDASLYNCSMDTLLIPLKLLVKGELESGERYLVKGCTPDSLDIFRYDVCLENPQVGNTIVFLNAGAYNFATDFCDLPKPPTRITD